MLEDPPDLDRLALIRCNWVLQTLMELCFLKSMSLDAEAIGTIAGKCERYRKVSDRFFR